MRRAAGCSVARSEAEEGAWGQALAEIYSDIGIEVLLAIIRLAPLEAPHVNTLRPAGVPTAASE